MTTSKPSTATVSDTMTASAARSDASSVRYRLDPRVSLWVLDVASEKPKFGVEIEQRRFQVSAGVHAILRALEVGALSLAELFDALSTGATRADRERVVHCVESDLVARGFVLREGEEPQPLPPKPRGGGYLRFSFPILPARFVGWIAAPLSALFLRPIVWLVLGAAVSAHLFFYFRVLPGFDGSLAELPASLLLTILVATTASTLFHEFGHAAACHAAGVRPGEIGWGVYIYQPVLYTDVGSAWKLRRRQRILVDLGGMYFESLAFVGLLCALVLSESTVLLYWLLLIDLNLIGSLNPILRRDGYWLVSDGLGEANLRSAHLGEIRRWLDRLRGRKPAEAPARSRRTRWAITLYSVVSIVFMIWLVTLLGKRVFVGLTESVPALWAAFGGTLPIAERVQKGTVVLVQLLILGLVLSSAWGLMLAIARGSRSSVTPEPLTSRSTT